MKNPLNKLYSQLQQWYGPQKVLKWMELLPQVKIPTPPQVQERWMILDKSRLARIFPLEHQFLQVLLSRKLSTLLANRLPKELVSYQKGKRLGQVFSDLRQFVNCHRASVSKKNWGLHVLRWDVLNYSDSIPTGDSSPLWDWLQKSGLSNHEVKLIRNEFQFEGKTQGIPFNSPLNPPIINLYLADFDRAIVNQFPGRFYRRFGDDCLLVSHLPFEESVIAFIADGLSQRGLQLNRDKWRSIYWSQLTTQRIEFLGRSISFRGLQFLTRKKVKAFYCDWNRFLERCCTDQKSVSLSALTIYFQKDERLLRGITRPTWMEIFDWVDDSSAVMDLSNKIRFKSPHMPKTLHTFWRESRF